VPKAPHQFLCVIKSLTFIKIRNAIYLTLPEFPRLQPSRTLRQISSSFKWQNFKALHTQVSGKEWEWCWEWKWSAGAWALVSIPNIVEWDSQAAPGFSPFSFTCLWPVFCF